jgi:hypothetical protein
MIKRILILITLFATVISCDNTKKNPETDVEVATAFVRDILDNNFKEAEQFLLMDETNRQYFDRFQQQYHTQDKKKLEKYKDAEIIVNEVSYVTDTICIFNYSNSYSVQEKTKLKLVRINHHWLVDLKYTFSGNL